MRRCSTMVLLALIILTTSAYAQEGTTLRLVQTIPLPHVEGRLDHLAVDLQGQRLFVWSGLFGRRLPEAGHRTHRPEWH